MSQSAHYKRISHEFKIIHLLFINADPGPLAGRSNPWGFGFWVWLKQANSIKKWAKDISTSLGYWYVCL